MKTLKSNGLPPTVVRPLKVLGHCHYCSADHNLTNAVDNPADIGDLLVPHDRPHGDGVTRCAGSLRAGDTPRWLIRGETLREQVRDMLLREHAEALDHGHLPRAELCSVALDAVRRELVWFALERAKRGILR